MSNENEIKIVLGSQQFAGNTDKDIWIQPPLIGDRRNMVEGDRSITINLADQFNTERQESDTFRISGKITNIFNNTVSGKTTYTPYRNSLYYTNAIANATLNTPPNPNIPWEGYPQFDEFTFGRFSAVTGHRNYVSKSAMSYNWMLYLTYPYSSDTTQPMSYKNENLNVTVNFSAGDGIPFVIKTGEILGKKVVYFYCGVKHNLSIGEWVEINIPTQPNGLGNKNVFKVFGLGDSNYRSEETVFSVIDLKFPANETTTGKNGTLKRIKNIVNSAETKSIYYVRLHKVIATHSEFNITQSGFENIPFNTKSKIEYSALTPNGEQRISVKEGSKTFSFILNRDININQYKDNNGKPLTELFLTTIQKGYMGWFNPPVTNSSGVQVGIDVGWGFNFLKNSIDPWWDHTSLNNKDNIPLSSYEQPQGSGKYFYYNDFIPTGATLKGDFCEFNFVEQKEYLLSKNYHKFSFNSSYFFDNSSSNLPSGYVYEPHYTIPIRIFSNYLEYGTKKNTVNIPSYAWFSEYEQNFIWRDIYTYGFIDAEGLGVDYPFTNGAHYPFANILFLQKPIQRTNEIATTIINPPTNDDCE